MTENAYRSWKIVILGVVAGGGLLLGWQALEIYRATLTPRGGDLDSKAPSLASRQEKDTISRKDESTPLPVKKQADSESEPGVVKEATKPAPEEETILVKLANHLNIDPDYRLYIDGQMVAKDHPVNNYDTYTSYALNITKIPKLDPPRIRGLEFKKKPGTYHVEVALRTLRTADYYPRSSVKFPYSFRGEEVRLEAGKTREVTFDVTLRQLEAFPHPAIPYEQLPTSIAMAKEYLREMPRDLQPLKDAFQEFQRSRKPVVYLSFPEDYVRGAKQYDADQIGKIVGWFYMKYQVTNLPTLILPKLTLEMLKPTAEQKAASAQHAAWEKELTQLREEIQRKIDEEFPPLNDFVKELRALEK